jgi:hypothetical protein
LAAEGVAPGFGKSSGFINRLKPGLSARQSPNAAAPTSGPGWPSAWPRPTTKITAVNQYEDRLRDHICLTAFHRSFSFTDVPKNLGDLKEIATPWVLALHDPVVLGDAIWIYRGGSFNLLRSFAHGLIDLHAVMPFQK